MNQNLEQAIAKVRSLPDARQQDAAEILEHLVEAGTDVYRLSEAKRAVLEPALARADRKEVATDDEVEAALRTPWR